MSETIKELLEREYPSGATVLNCVEHMTLSLLERPSDCNLCAADVKNQLSRAININEWLNTWKDDATKILEENKDG